MILGVLGDAHIPTRAKVIPPVALTILREAKVEKILFTGDLTDQKVLDWLNEIAPVMVVRGNMDHLALPEYEVLNIEGVKIGLIHGNQVHPRGNRKQLASISRELGVNVLISGHTHHPFYEECKDVILLNPRSITGVWGGSVTYANPSFMVLKVKNQEIKMTLYEIIEIEKRLRTKECVWRV